jgi:hypothetical protein
VLLKGRVPVDSEELKLSSGVSLHTKNQEERHCLDSSSGAAVDTHLL